MTDLNSASLADISAAGFDPVLARELRFWRPYRSWDQLLLLAGIDDAALDRLKNQGFEITAPDDASLSPPKPFKLSVAGLKPEPKGREAVDSGLNQTAPVHMAQEYQSAC